MTPKEAVRVLKASLAMDGATVGVVYDGEELDAAIYALLSDHARLEAEVERLAYELRGATAQAGEAEWRVEAAEAEISRLKAKEV